MLGHHGRVRTRHTGRAPTGTRTAGTRATGSLRTWAAGAIPTRTFRTGASVLRSHTLRRRERVVSRTRRARTRTRSGRFRSAGNRGTGLRTRLRCTGSTASRLRNTCAGTRRTGLRGTGLRGTGLRSTRLRCARFGSARLGRIRLGTRRCASGLRCRLPGLGGRARHRLRRRTQRRRCRGNLRRRTGTTGPGHRRLGAGLGNRLLRSGLGLIAGRRGSGAARCGFTGFAGGGLGGSLLGCGFVSAGGTLVIESIPEATHHGGFDGRRRRPHELPHVFQGCENLLAFESELLGELVDTDLGHYSPSGPCPWRGPVSCRTCSLALTHRVVMSVKPTF